MMCSQSLIVNAYEILLWYWTGCSMAVFHGLHEMPIVHMICYCCHRWPYCYAYELWCTVLALSQVWNKNYSYVSEILFTSCMTLVIWKYSPEATQRRKRRHQNRRKIITGCIGASLFVGTTGLILYKLFPWKQAILITPSNLGHESGEKGEI